MLIKIHSKIAKVSQALGPSVMHPNDPCRGTVRMMIVKGSQEELLKESIQPLVQTQSVVRNLRITLALSSLPHIPH